MNNHGRGISNAFLFASQVGQECEALGLLLKQEVGDLFRNQSALAKTYMPGEWTQSYQTDESGWVFTGVAWSLALSSKDQKKNLAYLSFQIAFICDNPEGGMSQEPLLHINLWDEPINFGDNCYMGFEMLDIAPPSLARLQKGEGRLFRWANNGGAEQWTYTLRLADINGLQDFRHLINCPVEQLIIDTDIGEAALEKFEQVVRYSVVDDMPDYYRVVSDEYFPATETTKRYPNSMMTSTYAGYTEGKRHRCEVLLRGSDIVIEYISDEGRCTYQGSKTAESHYCVRLKTNGYDYSATLTHIDADLLEGRWQENNGGNCSSGTWSIELSE